MPSARSKVDLGFRGSQELGQLIGDLRRQTTGSLFVKSQANLRAATAPVLADLRRAVMAVEVESSRGGFAPPVRDRGLRQAVAAALTVNPTTRGVRISVTDKKVDPKYGAVLPKYLDASLPKYQRWRHPVFGNDVWVTQRGQAWFFVTISRHERTFREAVLAALDDTIRELSR